MSGLLFAAFITKAATTSKVQEGKVKIETHQECKNLISGLYEETDAGLCTVTLKGSLFLGFIGIEVSCTGTAASCQQATEKAASCLQEAIKTVKQVLD